MLSEECWWPKKPINLCANKSGSLGAVITLHKKSRVNTTLSKFSWNCNLNSHFSDNFPWLSTSLYKVKYIYNYWQSIDVYELNTFSKRIQPRCSKREQRKKKVLLGFMAPRCRFANTIELLAPNYPSKLSKAAASASRQWCSSSAAIDTAFWLGI